MPSRNLPPLSVSLSLIFKYLIFFPSANLAMLSLTWLMMDITAILSLRGVMPISTIVALGAFSRHISRMALSPLVMSATLGSSLPRGATVPTLLVPARMTMILGLTFSSSPLVNRQRMFWIVSAPQPKLAAFQPKKFWRQFARKSLYCLSLVPHL